MEQLIWNHNQPFHSTHFLFVKPLTGVNRTSAIVEKQKIINVIWHIKKKVELNTNR